MIDKKSLITRHNPKYTRPDIEAPLSVGNGNFCFTADATGLQSLNEQYTRVPLCTMAGWGWHSYPNAPSDDKALQLKQYNTYGRKVGYAADHTGQEELFYSLRQNSHKVSLARVGFTLDGREPYSCSGFEQELDLWSGLLSSAFYTDGVQVKTLTFIRPDEDTICVRAVSSLIRDSRLNIALTFPYGSHRTSGADFNEAERHSTMILSREGQNIILRRKMDDLTYYTDITINADADVSFDGRHTLLFSGGTETLELSVRFRQGEQISKPGEFDSGRVACSAFWEKYWLEGGAIELAKSRDPRALELERRIVLSQYLIAIQSRGPLPPAETGLTINSWYGKFNVEMHFWHSAHFALWNKANELERSLDWYNSVLPIAREIAKSQGYAGARWPKLCDPSGYNSPSSIAVLLIWQQPHPIMLAELCRRLNPSRPLLEKYREAIRETAVFMCDFAHWDGKRYVLGPPYIPAQERFDPETVLNAGFEVEYFRWALYRADAWLRELGEPVDPRILEVADGLAEPIAYNGVYPAHENCPDTYSGPLSNTDHPSMTAMLGVLPGSKTDHGIMAATLDKILTDWDLESTWGWDFPMLAMTAARLGRREQAVDFLLMNQPKNVYLPNGHNQQGDKEDLPLYLPGNASLLLAAAMMAAGWDQDNGTHAPGFPESFHVEFENLHPYI